MPRIITARRGVACAMVLALAACGAAISLTGATSAGASSPTAQQLLAQGYAGAFQPPPTSGPKAVRGKTVWYISCGQTYIACVESADAFKAAGAALGWHVTVVDGKATPSVAAALIRQAIAAKVNGVGLFTYDCPGIKTALLQAKAAHMYVVNFGSIDCSDPAFGGGKALFAATENILGSNNAGAFWERDGEARATYIAGRLGGAKGTGKVLDINETTQRAHVYMEEGFSKQLKALCPHCVHVSVPFEFAEVPTQATQIWKAAMIANPDAKSVSWDTDALMELGLSTAIQEAHLPSTVLKDGNEGLPPNLGLIRSGQQTSAVGVPYTWYMYGLADTLNRLFAGDSSSQLPSEGGGFQYIDKSHNLPGAGQAVKVPINFIADYLKVWKG